MKKSFIISILIIIILIIGGWYVFNRYQNQVKIELDRLATEKPELKEYINDIKKTSEDFKKEPKLNNYLRLGLAWKSLADQTKNLKHYEKALKVYEGAIDLTQRKNTLPIINAANMAVYLKDYQLAKQYFEEAVIVAPGDFEVYQRLIEFHVVYLKSPKDEVVAVFDRGISRLINPEPLIKWKESYLTSLKENVPGN